MKAPSHLTESSQKWFVRMAADYVLGPHDLLVLQLAAESWDRCQQAREILAKEGVTFTDRHGHIRPHPATQLERDSRTSFARLIRDLNLPTPADVPEVDYA